MPFFDLRLYRKAAARKPLYQLVQEYRIEAADAAEARSLASGADIATFDNSDYAILFGHDNAELWTFRTEYHPD